jgi:hypothetical protein
MYGKPWHATRDLREKPFPEFIRAPWTTIVDKPGHFALSPSARGKPLNLDLDPVSGAPFENIPAMRGAKMRALLSLPDRGARAVHVTHPVPASARITDLPGSSAAPGEVSRPAGGCRRVPVGAGNDTGADLS